MSDVLLQPGNLVLYKRQAARVAQIQSKKITIQLQDGRSHSVRPKDVVLLHPGPITSFSEIQPCNGDIEMGWELLSGEITTLSDLAELIYADFSPATAWAAWELVADGELFSGTPDEIKVHEAEQVNQIRQNRAAKAAEEKAWSAFLRRAAHDEYAPEDQAYIEDVVALALGQRDGSRVLRSLGRTEDTQNAHEFLIQIGYWDETVNPYPSRFDVITAASQLALPNLPTEDRCDLTHLEAFAIDDSGNTDPDDAISWEDGRLWVHIADAAALVQPDSEVDLEARIRGTNLYLPEQTVAMLPAKAVELLGLGLQEVSPALSFAIDLTGEAEVSNVEIMASLVRVKRLTYDEVDQRLDEPPFAQLYELAQRHEERRLANGSVVINLPEVKVQVVDGGVNITPLPALRSRDLVREAMLMTGVAVAQYAVANRIPLPFSTQPPPDENSAHDSLDPYSMSAMFALRKSMRPSSQKSSPAPHAGLGLDLYVQATSPLRRYLDLVVHQQLRAHIAGAPMLDEQALLERVGAASAVIGNVRRAERLSIRHWALVYLLRNLQWRGDGIIVEQRGARSTILVPDLGVETQLFGLQNLGLDSIIPLQADSVDLPALEARFRTIK